MQDYTVIVSLGEIGISLGAESEDDAIMRAVEIIDQQYPDLSKDSTYEIYNPAKES
jgi:hypothetical protein